ncbi:MAG: transcription-repair coupling factor [Sphingomonadales bacterium]|nr:transcription-repair coupling factor [Sphingomonadales bacterium]
MVVQDLLAAYGNSPLHFLLRDRLTMPAPQTTHLQGLQGSSAAFVMAAALQQDQLSSYNHLIICNDAEEAAYFHNTLESLTRSLDCFYFPSSFKNSKNFQGLNPSHVMLRTEALTRMAERADATGVLRKKILVSYPEAVAEKVVVPELLSARVIAIKTGSSLDVPALLLQLSEYGFERVDFVYEPGQVAMRGGILDIYSVGNDKPYRIELFGHEVDSIRIVDPETQLSERKLSQVSIIPRIDTQVSSGQQISLLEFLPEHTLVWMQDRQFCLDKVDDTCTSFEQFMQGVAAQPQLSAGQEEGDEKWMSSIEEQRIVTAKQFEQLLERRQLINWGTAASDAERADTTVAAPIAVVIEHQTKAQPAFNRQFERLIADLKNWEAKQYQVHIFSDSAKQLERLQSIFDDLSAGVVFHPHTQAIHEGFIDHDLKLVCYTDHQLFQRYHKYKVKQAYSKNKALTLRTLRELQPGDFVTHIDHGVGVFSGLQKIEVNGRSQEAVRLVYRDSDILYVNINSLHKIAKYSGKEGTVPKINKLGTDLWNRLKEKTKTRVKEIAVDLIGLYAKRKAQQGYSHAPDNYLQLELEASFIYEDTPDQSRATADVKKDMESASPMDRLVCGDVGFGKTEVAIRAAFKTCVDGKQAAVLVPTTILAFQHYKTFKERLKDFPVTVDYINRFKSVKEKKQTLQRLKEGKIDIIIGTHGLLAKDVQFKDLGLLVIDEEQKFGVAHKEKIKELRTVVDCLTLTATPIPRTLQFSLMGARDLSIINTPPSNRQPIQTEVLVYNEDAVREAIYFEAERGGQVFFIYNRVAGLPEMAGIIQGLCPDLQVGYAHGQMEGHVLEQRILDFIDRKYDVLVCTNIVESGVDIPNVNTIIVNNAHQFGLSDLHQLRGRVGRSNKKAFCYLLAPPMSTLPNDSRRRLQTLEQHSELGSGFQIAMRDLDIRGAGNLLGGEQSGFMAEIGFEMYQKILEEAIRELKRKEFKELFKEEIARQDDYVQDCTIDTDLEILIPDEYVSNITERLSLYQRLDSCETDEELECMRLEMIDRFGALPAAVEELFITVRCRKMALQLGFEKMSLKEELLRCFFINRPDSPYFESDTFKAIIAYLQTQTRRGQLKQNGRNFLLVVSEVRGMSDVQRFLEELLQYLQKKEAMPQ